MLLKTKKNGRFGGENEPREAKCFAPKRIGHKSAPIFVVIRTHTKAKTKRKNLTALFPCRIGPILLLIGGRLSACFIGFLRADNMPDITRNGKALAFPAAFGDNTI
jgi:hypothetical protein